MGEENTVNEIGEMLESMGQKAADETVILETEVEETEVVEEETSTQEVDEVEDEVVEEDEQVDTAGEDEVEDTDDEDVDDEEVSELDLLKAQKDELLKLVNELSTPESAKTEETTEESDTESLNDFIGDLDLETLVEDKEKFNAVLSKVVDVAAQQGEVRAAKKILTALPQLVLGHVNQQLTLQREVKKFYTDNPDLKEVAPYLGKVATKVASEHPDYTPAQVFEEAGKVARKSLGLAEKAKKVVSKESKKRPAFAKAGGSRKPTKTKSSGLEKEFADMLKLEEM